MAEVTTIQLSRETVEYLRVLKEIYRYKTYEDLIKTIITRPYYEYPIDLSRVVPPLTKIERGENQFVIRDNGIITEVFIIAPPGNSGLVEIWVGVDKDTIIPYGWSAENPRGLTGEFVKSFKVNYPVRAGQTIWAEFANHSDTFEYPITCLVTFSNKLLPVAVKPEEVGIWRG